ncbi:MAG: A24 family peptidase [Elusimicrobiota bacterium]
MGLSALTDVLLLLLLAVASLTDIKFRKIYNWLTLPAITFGFLNGFFQRGFLGLQDSFLGILAGTVLIMPFYLLKGIGAGDVKLCAAVGSIMGWNFTLLGLFLGSIIAGLYCLVIVLKRKNFPTVYKKVRNFFLFLFALRTVVPVEKEDTLFIPYGTFLCLGFFLNYIAGTVPL